MENVQRPDGAFRRMSREQLLTDLPADIHKAAGQALEAMGDSPEAISSVQAASPKGKSNGCKARLRGCFGIFARKIDFRAAPALS